MKARVFALARYGAFTRCPVSRHGVLPAALRACSPALTRAVFWAEGLYALLVLVLLPWLMTASVMPEAFGATRGGFTADMVAMACAAALLLTGVFWLLALLPRAGCMLYAECARRSFGFTRGEKALLSGAWRDTRGRYGAWMLAVLLAAAATALVCALLYPTRVSYLALPLAWLFTSLLRLTMPAAVVEGRRGLSAVGRSVALSLKRAHVVLPRRLLYELPLLLAIGFLYLYGVGLAGEDLRVVPALAIPVAALLTALWPYLAGLDTALYWRAVSDGEKVQKLSTSDAPAAPFSAAQADVPAAVDGGAFVPDAGPDTQSAAAAAGEPAVPDAGAAEKQEETTDENA